MTDFSAGSSGFRRLLDYEFIKGRNYFIKIRSTTENREEKIVKFESRSQDVYRFYILYTRDSKSYNPTTNELEYNEWKIDNRNEMRINVQDININPDTNGDITIYDIGDLGQRISRTQSPDTVIREEENSSLRPKSIGGKSKSKKRKRNTKRTAKRNRKSLRVRKT